MKDNTKNQAAQAEDFIRQMEQIILSARESVQNAASTDEAWNKIDLCYQALASLRGQQGCPVLTDSMEGHTRYLQGLSLPIMVNSITAYDGDVLLPSEVSEMNIEEVNGMQTLVITPSEIIG